MNVPMPSLLGQITERIRGINGGYPDRETAGTALFVLLFIAGAVLLAYLLTKRQQPPPAVRTTGDPHRLFADLMREMTLTHPKRQFLSSLAREMKLDHPSVLILSPALFQVAVEQSESGSGGRDDHGVLVDQLRQKLFPTP